MLELSVSILGKKLGSLHLVSDIPWKHETSIVLLQDKQLQCNLIHFDMMMKCREHELDLCPIFFLPQIKCLNLTRL